MASYLMRLAHKIYRATPFPWLRSVYFKGFCLAVRHRTVQRQIDGTWFELDLGETIDLALYLGQFEPDVVRAIDTNAQAGMTVLDVGANIGAHTLRFAQRVGTTGHVYAFEPTSFAFRKLNRNLLLNQFPQVEAFQVALSDQNALQREVRFRSSWRTDGRRQVDVDHVDFVRLDDWCSREGVERVDLVKLDVDGNEFPVIAGGLALIGRCRPTFIIEAVGPHFEDDSRNPYAVLAGFGYRFRDAKTHVEYRAVHEIGARLPRGDYEMTQSLNILAQA